jgi:hypothetical protein
MLKIVFILVIAIHGLIHLLGFVKAFDMANITELSLPISKPMGMAWLVASVLFLTSAVLYIMSYRIWPFIAISAVILSQIIIFTAWGDAKFGTIANVIILLVALPAMGDWFFHNKVSSEQEYLLEQVSQPNDKDVQKEDLQHLPEIVQAWLRNSGVVGKPEVTFVRLKQTGQMKTSPDGRWMDFSAVQYFDVKNTSFNWKVDVKMLPLITLTGRDKLMDGQGEMLIKLLSLINVVDEKQNEQINTGTMIRFLGEICWFPSAALNDFIRWEEIDEHSAKATMTIGKQQVSGIFRFSESGDFQFFEADRYYGGAEDAVLRKWVVEAEEYNRFNGNRIPNKLSVTWKLPEGDFTWLYLEITDLDINRFELYSMNGR